MIHKSTDVNFSKTKLIAHQDSIRSSQLHWHTKHRWHTKNRNSNNCRISNTKRNHVIHAPIMALKRVSTYSPSSSPPSGWGEAAGTTALPNWRVLRTPNIALIAPYNITYNPFKFIVYFSTCLHGCASHTILCIHMQLYNNAQEWDHVVYRYVVCVHRRRKKIIMQTENPGKCCRSIRW